VRRSSDNSYGAAPDFVKSPDWHTILARILTIFRFQDIGKVVFLAPYLE
jgi:hypothetical protein